MDKIIEKLIKLTEKININVDINKTWAFITDFSVSLNFNKFHAKIKIPANYSISNIKKFMIIHNFGFGQYEMDAEITECIPPNRLCFYEYCKDAKDKGFPHITEFMLESTRCGTTLLYTVEGTYGSMVQNVSFKPILKHVMIDELLKIKNAIESSNEITNQMTSETVKPI